MHISVFLPTDPAPLIVALETMHMIAARLFLYTNMAIRTVRKVALFEPIRVFCSSNCHFGFLASLAAMELPTDFAFSTESMLANWAFGFLCFFVVTLNHLRAFRVWTVR